MMMSKKKHRSSEYWEEKYYETLRQLREIKKYYSVIQKQNVKLKSRLRKFNSYKIEERK